MEAFEETKYKFKDKYFQEGVLYIYSIYYILATIVLAPLLVWFLDIGTLIKVCVTIASVLGLMIIVIFVQFLLSVFEIVKNTRESRDEVYLVRMLLLDRLAHSSKQVAQLDQKGKKLIQQAECLIEQVAELTQQVTKPGPQETQVDRQVVEPEQQDANRPQRIPLPENRMGKWTRIKPIDLKFD